MRIEVRATWLKTRRKQRGLTQRQLAKMLGVTQNYLPAIEAGTRTPGAALRTKLSQALGFPFEEIFEVVMVDPTTGKETRLTAESEPAAVLPSAAEKH